MASKKPEKPKPIVEKKAVPKVPKAVVPEKPKAEPKAVKAPTKAAVIKPAKVAVPTVEEPKVRKKAKVEEPEATVDNQSVPPIVPHYTPNENDTVARVYIESKCVTAYRMPLVDKPPTRFADTKTFGKENWPAQPKTYLPDPFPELDDKTRAYLRLWPYGDNIVINRKHLAELLPFYMDIREMPLPEDLQRKLKDQMEYTRGLLNLITIEESERNSELRKILGENWQPTFPYFKCKCQNKKRRVKSSPGAKALKSTTKKELEEDDDED